MPVGVMAAIGFLFLFMVMMAGATFVAARVLGLAWEDPAGWAMAMAAHLVLLLPVWMFIGLFLLAPLLCRLGVLRHLSPYLMVTRGRDGSLHLHGATPMDYLFLFRWRDRGRPAVRQILLWYLDGLINLAGEIEAGRWPGDVRITATSYIFSGQTARRLGFAVEESPWLAWGGALTYPTQFFTYSFARGRWAAPPIHRTRRAMVSGERLVARVDGLRRLQRRLEARAEQRLNTPDRKVDRR